MTPPILFNAVTKRYGSATAIDAVTLAIEKNEFCALLGPNGAGKTTLVRMLMGFSRPDSGSAVLCGLPSTDCRARQRVGYLAENHRIPPHLTARQYLMRHARLAGISGPAASDEVARALNMVGMREKSESRAGSYSKGMTQRVGIAAALLGQPGVLILDEPVSGLDPVGIREIRLILDTLRSRGTTVLLNSHLLSEVEKTCSMAAIINRGKILASGKLAELVPRGETLEDLFVRLVKEPHV